MVRPLQRHRAHDDWQPTEQHSDADEGDKVKRKLSKEYRDYIKSPEWYAHKREVMRRDNNECVVCGKISTYHDVHHESYQHFKTADEIDDCITVCREHHKGLHRTIKYLQKWKN
jgi:5-methylcytosine-specific restriction endonuclease McrA